MAKSDISQTGNEDGSMKSKQAGKAKTLSAGAKPGEIIIKFKPGVCERRIREIAAREDLEVIKIVSPPSVYLFKSRETSQALLNKRIIDLKKYSEIEYAEPNYIAIPARN
jgi:hypothetical protein